MDKRPELNVSFGQVKAAPPTGRRFQVIICAEAQSSADRARATIDSGSLSTGPRMLESSTE